jgi:hypothetical protein
MNVSGRKGTRRQGGKILLAFVLKVTVRTVFPYMCLSAARNYACMRIEAMCAGVQTQRLVFWSNEGSRTSRRSSRISPLSFCGQFWRELEDPLKLREIAAGMVASVHQDAPFFDKVN